MAQLAAARQQHDARSAAPQILMVFGSPVPELKRTGKAAARAMLETSHRSRGSRSRRRAPVLCASPARGGCRMFGHSLASYRSFDLCHGSHTGSRARAVAWTCKSLHEAPLAPWLVV